MKRISLLFLTLVFVQYGYSKTWKVGTARTYTKPSQVSSLVGNGDTVEIDAGTYESDVAKWTADNLLLKGVGGMAHLKSNGTASGGKGIWVIAGNNTRVEYIEFSLCSVPDNNGAGIRLEGKNLRVSHCYFHNNENGILAGKVNPSTVIIEYSEFGYNGFGDGFTHNLYINNIDTLIFRYNYSHHASVGHELKSRANVNYILYNRLSDESTSTASRNIDLPNGGTSYIIGNVIEQGPLTENSNIIGYGLEGLTNTAPHEMYAVNNTIVNNRSAGGSFFMFQSGTAMFKAYNNILAGPGSFTPGYFTESVDTSNNRVSASISSFGFVNVAKYDYHLTGNSTPVINLGKNPGTAHSISLDAVKEYDHPNNEKRRCTFFGIDIGAFEYCVDGIAEMSLKNLVIYPNPAKDYLIIKNQSLISYSVYDITGKLLLEAIEIVKDPETKLDISSLSPGLYFLSMQTDKGLITQRFVKED